MARTRPTFLAIAILSLAYPALAGEPGKSPEAPPANPAPAGESVKLRLIGQGQEPRRTLRLTPKKGDSQRVEMVMDMGMEMAMGKREGRTITIPPIRIGLDLTVDDVREGGDIAYSFTLSKARVDDSKKDPGGLIGPMRKALPELEGSKGSGVLSSRGLSKESSFEAPNVQGAARTMLASLKQSLNKLGSPLPEEAVGVGASWEATTTIDSGGIVLEQVAIYEVESLSERGVKLRVGVTQKGDKQQLRGPGVPDGTTITLKRLSSTGKGESEIDLSRLSPVESVMRLKSESEMTLEVGGETPILQEMSQKMEMTVRMGDAAKPERGPGKERATENDTKKAGNPK